MNKENTKFLSIVTLFWFAQYVYVPYQTPFLTAINVTSGFVGLIIGSYGFAQMVLRIPLGMLADWHLNHQVIIVTGTLLTGLAALIRLIFQTGIGFLIGNIVSGIASATWLSFIVLFLKINSNASKVENMAVLVMVNNLGILLGFLVSSLLYSSLAMSGLCLFSALAGMLAFILSLTLPQLKFKKNAGKKPLGKLGQVFKNKTLIVCGALAFIQQGIQQSTTMSLTMQMVREIGAPAYSEGLSAIVYMGSAVLLAKSTSAKYLTKFTRRGILLVSFILLAGYCFLIPLVSSIYLIYLLQIIPGIGTGILFTILNAEAISVVPSNTLSTATGVFQSIYALGMTTLPIFAGQLCARYSITISFFSMGLFALIGGLIVIKFWPK
ncbi:MFS transporter [Lactobacillus xylocopicola]|uniref:MFS transporter n=1 Tax=Lactobacillus xylocopicola TaxID=2976676 RepID=A0ABM8BFN4_9LACO|nr:MFS transporter [Lactobacillus xylocopicola]BDR59924.1 MFS transporter [Lactobacillus xylocopicola]